jgi:hypothetical protein
MEMPTNAQVFAAAQRHYSVRSERPPRDTTDYSLPPGHSVPENDAPIMTIATMTANPGPILFPGKILARITSSRDYKPMGIKQGPNILWRDAYKRVWITPQSNGPHEELNQVPRYIFPLEPGHEPSLLRVKTNSFAFIACLDDCGSGHCGMF